MRRFWSPLIVLALLAPVRTVDAAAGPQPGRSLVVYTMDGHDRRIAAATRAAAFWNQTLKELGLARPFIEPRVVVSPRLTRLLQTYALRISKDGWRDDREFSPGTPALAAPPEIAGLQGDVIVLLATEPILSFGWPLGAGRYFVTIRSDKVPPLDNDVARRNVMAHELGHTLGLTHNGSHGLMCASCDLSSNAGGAPYLPLSSEDIAHLTPPE